VVCECYDKACCVIGSCEPLQGFAQERVGGRAVRDSQEIEYCPQRKAGAQVCDANPDILKRGSFQGMIRHRKLYSSQLEKESYHRPSSVVGAYAREASIMAFLQLPTSWFKTAAYAFTTYVSSFRILKATTQIRFTIVGLDTVLLGACPRRLPRIPTSFEKDTRSVSSTILGFLYLVSLRKERSASEDA
jgi:hypothetical protein